jgi:hypothetical protein
MLLAFALLFVVAVAAPAAAVEKANSAVSARERINKVWDEGLKKIWFRQIEAGCKADAKKQYSAMRFNKRRQFVEQCVDNATAPGAVQSIHQPN